MKIKSILVALGVFGAVQVLAAPTVTSPVLSTTTVTTSVGAQAPVTTETTFWSSAKTFNAGIIDVLKRVLVRGSMLFFR